jgi:rhomboid protease GluP
MPLQDADGRYRIYDHINILTKDAFGSLVIIELLDGDMFTAEEIKERLRGNQSTIQHTEVGVAQYLYEVFIFSSYPDIDKLNAIKSAQLQKPIGKKYVKCLSVNLENKSVEKHFKLPLTDMGIGKTMKAILKEGIYKEIENDDIENVIIQKKKEFQIKLEAKAPILTYLFIALNIIIWVAIKIYSNKSGTKFEDSLLYFGSKENAHILSGEYWRFVTPIFLHLDEVHLFVNCYSLYSLNIVERLFGHAKFLTIYLIAGILGNVASFLFSINPGVGASGAIFGLLGSLLYLGLKKPALFKAYFGANVLITIFINLAYGFSRSGIDNFAHIGGLIGGFLATGAVSATDKAKWYLNRFIYIAVIIVLLASSLLYGFNNKENKIILKVNEMEELDKSQKWNEVIKIGKEILALNPGSELSKISVYWSLTKAQGMIGDYDSAAESAKKLIEIDPKDGHYLLGLIYFDMGQYQNSRDELLEAKKLKAGYKNIDDLLANIDQILKNR